VDSPFPADRSVRATVASMQSPLGHANVAWEAIGRCITLLQCGRYDETTHEYPLVLRMSEWLTFGLLKFDWGPVWLG
jgi:hypothetical protein